MKINFNLEAKEYKPKVKPKKKKLDEDDEEVNNKMDMIVNDMVESDLIEGEKDNDLEDEDENKFFINIKIVHVVKDMFINVMEKLVNH